MATCLAVVALAGTAAAAPGFDVTIPVNTVVRAPEGSVTPLRGADVPAEAEGQRCSVVSHAENQRSVHPGNNLIVQSGSSEVLLPDVEGLAGATVEGIGTLTLGESISVSLEMGPDEVFSGGFDVVIECELRPGEIVVEKVVLGDLGGSPSFGFEASYDSDGFSLADGEQNSSGELEPGTYSVSETVPDGWTLQSAVCDNDDDPASIELGEGETVTCTFTNEFVDEVMASIQVTVEGRCEADGDEGEGIIDVTISVDDGATVVVEDSDGDVVGTSTSDGTISVAEGATYTWEATPSEGFEFPPGSDSSGSITIETCSDDPETLPFTGPETEWLPLLASLLVGTGLALVLAMRKRAE